MLVAENTYIVNSSDNGIPVPFDFEALFADVRRAHPMIFDNENSYIITAPESIYIISSTDNPLTDTIRAGMVPWAHDDACSVSPLLFDDANGYLLSAPFSLFADF